MSVLSPETAAAWGSRTGLSTLVRRLSKVLFVEDRAGRVADGSNRFFDQLENRQLFANSALPTLSALENQNNAVIRIETTLGDIDIELFSSQAPITVANFLNYVNSGRFAETFFHRDAQNGSSAAAEQPLPTGTNFVLQGGGYKFGPDATGTNRLTQIATDNSIVLENTGRLNLTRTLSMARTNSPNSATSQFFINMADNSFLDPSSSSDGYAVFGRVIQGWDVVTAINGLTRYNLTNNAAFIPASGQTNYSSIMSEVPTIAYTGGTITRSNLVYIVNAELIKSADLTGFNQYALTFADGFRSNSATETLYLHNEDATSNAFYQVVVRYDRNQRDTVIDQGVVAPGASQTIRISDRLDGALNKVRRDTPYSITVKSARPSNASTNVPLVASFARSDFGAATLVNGFDSAIYGLSNSEQEQFKTWSFARVERNLTSREFIVWNNLSAATATVTLTVLNDAGATVTTRTYTTDAYRRGGMAFENIGIQIAGNYSVLLTSDQPIVAQLSDWDLTTGGQTETGATPGWTVIGANGAPSQGVFSGVSSATTNTLNLLSFVNATTSQQTITLTMIRSSGTSTQIDRTIGARSRLDIVGADLDVPAGELFTVMYASAAGVTGQYTSIDITNRYVPGASARDGMSTMAQIYSGGKAFIAGAGLSDPSRAGSTLNETISVFNPFATGAIGGTFSFSLSYHFSDGEVITTNTFTPAARSRLDVRTSDLSAVMAKINTNSVFRNYSITVNGTATSTPAFVSGFVSYSRIDSGLGTQVSTGAGLVRSGAAGILRDITDPIFYPSNG
jgi:peptidyl-prolyl cis-trans isomerase A (cyclophilin A)